MRKQEGLPATPEDKPAEKEATPPVDSSPIIARDFPAGNVADIKRTSLFLSDDYGKATKAWWADTKGISVCN